MHTDIPTLSCGSPLCGGKIIDLENSLSTAGCPAYVRSMWMSTVARTVDVGIRMHTPHHAYIDQQPTRNPTHKMSDRSEKIVVYVTESTKNAVKHEAATEDKSMAEWSRNQIHRGLKNKQEDRMLHETNAEQRINQLISEMDDRLATRLQNYQDLMGVAANYACANHILFQKFDGIGSKLADDARSDASEIIKRSTGYQQQQPQQSNARESRAQSEQQQQQQQQQADGTLPGQKPTQKQEQADDGPTSFDEIE